LVLHASGASVRGAFKESPQNPSVRFGSEPPRAPRVAGQSLRDWK